MIGVPPICQSPVGKGGESNGAGSPRLVTWAGAVVSGGVYAGVFQSLANASQRGTDWALAVVWATASAPAARRRWVDVCTPIEYEAPELAPREISIKTARR